MQLRVLIKINEVVVTLINFIASNDHHLLSKFSKKIWHLTIHSIDLAITITITVIIVIITITVIIIVTVTVTVIVR